MYKPRIPDRTEWKEGGRNRIKEIDNIKGERQST
jgi:hypothetical protein